MSWLAARANLLTFQVFYPVLFNTVMMYPPEHMGDTANIPAYSFMLFLLLKVNPVKKKSKSSEKKTAS